ncbi:alpha/beta hydrolase [Ramlibacter sp. WS9]|uniref:alpha/beta hydrolase n=1 Tax=Ramlibacter sp. WS9 TaxID=1882741 RepID=UPI001144527D|nr:alpha/beta hydrolase [Ramlibacter sp. WS9]ROZ75108.1 alpha/beta hydrolase [Ramlibacter sp. WS9]
MLHPQTRGLLRRIEDGGAPPLHALEPNEGRVAYRDRGAATQPSPPAVALSRQLVMPGPGGPMALRLYRPAGGQENQALPALVYFHGGGWVVGDLDTHDTLCRELANGSGCAIVAVHYRLAPEHRFPAAADDALAALKWVAGNAPALSIDAERLAVGGDSAGGNLAAVTALAAREVGGLGLRFQLLIYPVTDMRRVARSHQANGQGYLLTSDALAYCCGEYVGDEKGFLDWRASPLLHKDHSNLPPAFVLTAGFDPLRDEGAQYAQRLSEAGSRATLICFERQVHGFFTMGKVIDEAGVAVQLCAAQLKAALLPR